MKYAKIKGLSEARLAIRKLPAAVSKEVRHELANVANKMQKDAISFAPRSRRRGLIHLQNLIGIKFSRDGLSVKIGSTERIIGKRLFKKGGWRAIFILFGTKGGTVKSGPFAGARIPPMPANNYLLKAFAANESQYINRVGAAFRRALREADSRGIRGRF